MTTSAGRGPAGFLDGVRVLEVADELGEYCGRVLAGVGADVVKIEPPTGEVTRSYGPFAGDRPDPEGSLWWWYYNTSKRGITLVLYNIRKSPVLENQKFNPFCLMTIGAIGMTFSCLRRAFFKEANLQTRMAP